MQNAISRNNYQVYQAEEFTSHHKQLSWYITHEQHGLIKYPQDVVARYINGISPEDISDLSNEKIKSPLITF